MRKKLLSTIAAIFIIGISNNTSLAVDTISVSNYSQTDIDNNKISITMTVSGSVDNDNTILYVVPKESGLSGSSAASVPISKFRVFQPNLSSWSTDFVQNQEYELYTVPTAGAYSQNIQFEINNVGGFPTDTYATNFDYILKYGGTPTATQNQALTMVRCDVLEISNNMPVPTINVPAEDVFDTDFEVNNDTNTTLTISSNMPWKIYIDTTGFGATDVATLYCCWPTTPDPDVTISTVEVEDMVQDQMYLVAEGNATVDGSYTLGTRSVVLRYEFCKRPNPDIPMAELQVRPLAYELSNE